MWDRPVFFVILNVALFFIGISIFDFEFAPIIASLVAFLIVLYNTRKIGVANSVVLSIIYLLIFDSEVFTFTDFNLRIWYVLLLVVGGIYIVRLMLGKVPRSWSFYACAVAFSIFMLFACSAIYFVSEPAIAKLYNLKYWLFYVGLIFVLTKFFNDFSDDFNSISNYLISIFVFVCLWGLIQFYFNYQGIFQYAYDGYNIRPSAFFSETTWYSEFLVFGIFLILLKINVTRASKLYILLPFFLLGIVVSATRNAYLGVAVAIIIEALFILVGDKIKLNWSLAGKVIAANLIIIMIGSFFLKDQIWLYVEMIQDKFTLADMSAQGRIEAFEMSMQSIMQSPVFGQGFFWAEDMTTQSGSAIGAKSSNLFLMIFHIFGLVGLIPFLLLLSIFYWRSIQGYMIRRSPFARYGIINFSVFLMMAMFAPIHQFPFGMLMVALSIYYIRVALRERKDMFYNATI